MCSYKRKVFQTSQAVFISTRDYFRGKVSSKTVVVACFHKIARISCPCLMRVEEIAFIYFFIADVNHIT